MNSKYFVYIFSSTDLRCMQNDSISNLQEFTNYIKECQVFLQDVLKRLPLHANGKVELKKLV